MWWNTITVLFQSQLSKSTANKCLTGGNKEQDEQETRYSKQQHPRTKTQFKVGKKTNRKS